MKDKELRRDVGVGWRPCFRSPNCVFVWYFDFSYCRHLHCVWTGSYVYRSRIEKDLWRLHRTIWGWPANRSYGRWEEEAELSPANDSSVFPRRSLVFRTSAVGYVELMCRVGMVWFIPVTVYRSNFIQSGAEMTKRGFSVVKQPITWGFCDTLYININRNSSSPCHPTLLRHTWRSLTDVWWCVVSSKHIKQNPQALNTFSREIRTVVRLLIDRLKLY
jgi:hypothetical protein